MIKSHAFTQSQSDIVEQNKKINQEKKEQQERLIQDYKDKHTRTSLKARKKEDIFETKLQIAKMDEIKKINSLIAQTQVYQVRDRQVQERKQERCQHIDYLKNLDKMEEINRVQKINEEQTKYDENKCQLKQNNEYLIKQIQEKTNKYQDERENIYRDESKQIKVWQKEDKQLQNDEKIKKRKDLIEGLNHGNSQLQSKRNQLREIEQLELFQVEQYQKQRDLQLESYKQEQKRTFINKEKEKEKLINMQNKNQSLYQNIDAQRQKRQNEAYEMKFIEGEKMKQQQKVQLIFVEITYLISIGFQRQLNLRLNLDLELKYNSQKFRKGKIIIRVIELKQQIKNQNHKILCQNNQMKLQDQMIQKIEKKQEMHSKKIEERCNLNDSLDDYQNLLIHEKEKKNEYLKQLGVSPFYQNQLQKASIRKI